MRKRLFALTIVALVAALMLPASALAHNWSKSPADPLVKGGVHSKAKFTSLLSSNAKVRKALRGVLKADGYPSWVFDAAVAQAKKGNIYSGSLNTGAKIGAMAFGTKKTVIKKNTIWTGDGHLPYYYVYASQTVLENGYNVTTTYRVCLAKTCANPFAFKRQVTRRLAPPTTHSLYMRVISQQPILTESVTYVSQNVTGTVGADSIDMMSSDSTYTLVGSYPTGTPYSLKLNLSGPWGPQWPTDGLIEGNMPDADTYLDFTIQEIPW
jgi:hypothetical protein